MKVSVIIPIYNERENIDALYMQLHPVLNAMDESQDKLPFTVRKTRNLLTVVDAA